MVRALHVQMKHVRGVLSMGRYDDPNSATSSFSILLGDAPHLDGQYCAFGKAWRPPPLHRPAGP